MKPILTYAVSLKCSLILYPRLLQSLRSILLTSGFPSRICYVLAPPEWYSIEWERSVSRPHAFLYGCEIKSFMVVLLTEKLTFVVVYKVNIFVVVIQWTRMSEKELKFNS